MAGLGEVAGGFQVVGVMLVAGGLVLVQDPKKSCRISMSSQTADINQEQEQQEQDIPEQDPNRVVEDGEAGDAEMEDLVDEDLYERGPALMPPVPREEDKVALTPVGDR